MADFRIELDRIAASSDDLRTVKNKLNTLKSDVDSINLSGILEASYRSQIDAALRRASEKIMDEAVRMDSLGSALNYAVTQYLNAENAILNSESALNDGSAQNADNRNWWQRFWDWLTGNESDDHEPTALEREKAADDAMRKALRDELRDYKYSRLHWTFASVDERKRILQDYMTAVITIYGLQHVAAEITWANDATYTERSITWGYYSPDTRTVTLNERALSDDISTWDCYELIGTVSHELRHAYQHEAIENPAEFMVSEETVEAWRNNFPGYGEYISSSQDYQRYRDQPIERDARSFEVDRPFLGLF